MRNFLYSLYGLSITASLALAAVIPRDTGRIIVLDIGLQKLMQGRIFSVLPDGSDVRTIKHVSSLPDGPIVDQSADYLYWTNMGIPGTNTGSIQRSGLDGSNVVTIVPSGTVNTPKQIFLTQDRTKLYWCDREGMRVMRGNPDGSNVETLHVAGTGPLDQADKRNWPVGIAVDERDQKFYWTQKGKDDAGQGRIFRAPVNFKPGESGSNRSDIELLLDNLPEPIDLEIDPKSRQLYWTDRGNKPGGNSVSVASVDNLTSDNKLQQKVIVEGLHEGIGISLDVPRNRAFFTDLDGGLYSSSLDGSNKKVLLQNAGNFTGLTYVPTL